MDDYSWQDYIERKSSNVVKMKKHGLMQVDANLIADESHWKSQADDRNGLVLATGL